MGASSSATQAVAGRPLDCAASSSRSASFSAKYRCPPSTMPVLLLFVFVFASVIDFALPAHLFNCPHIFRREAEVPAGGDVIGNSPRVRRSPDRPSRPSELPDGVP